MSNIYVSVCYCLWKSKPLKQAKIEINSVNCQETNEYQIDKDKILRETQSQMAGDLDR